MHRRVAFVLFLAAALARPSLAGEPRVVLDGPSEVRTPYEIGVVTGRVEGGSGLRVLLQDEGRVRTIEVPLGTDAIVVERAEAEERWIDALRERVDSLEVRGAAVAGTEEGAAVVRFPTARDDRRPEVLRALRARPTASLELKIEARPRERYSVDADADVPRLAPADPAMWPWSGTAAQFDEFRKAEIARWRSAARAGEAYVPSRPGLTLARRAGTTGASDADFVVLEEPRSAEETFDTETFRFTHTSRDEKGWPSLLFDIAPVRRKAFRAFTERNVHLPLAILVDGEVTAAPVVLSPLEDNFQVAVGGGSPAERERDAKDLERRLDGGGPTAGRARPHALIRLAPEGSFQISVPLGESGVSVEIRPLAASPETPGARADLRHVPDAVLAPSHLIESYLALRAWGRELPPGDAAKVVVALLRFTTPTGLRTRRALEELAPQAMAEVEAALADPHADVRAAALGVIATHPRHAADVRRLIAAARDTDVTVRLAAYLGLRNLFVMRTLPSDDLQPFVAEAVAVLAEVVGEGTTSAAYALAVIPEGESVLVRWTASSDASRREVAFGALAFSGSHSAGTMAAFERGMKDASPPVRYVAAMGHRKGAGDPAPSNEVLHRLATDPTVEAQVRLGAAVMPHLVSEPTEADWSFLGTLLLGPDETLRRAAAVLLASAGKADEATRRLADETIATSPEDLQFLVKALRDLDRLPREPAPR